MTHYVVEREGSLAPWHVANGNANGDVPRDGDVASLAATVTPSELSVPMGVTIRVV